MAEKLTSVELTSVELHETRPRGLARDESFWSEDDVDTALGTIHVEVQGDRRKKALITYHDIGLNSKTCFQGFFSYTDMQPILRHFCVYHINAPGQQEGALPLPHGYQYPSMDTLADMMLPVLQFYGIKSFIGFGVGAGANILSRFALSHPDRVDGLCLLNSTSTKAGWTEWGFQKWNTWYLKSGQRTAGVEEYLLWHWFGKKTMGENYDLVSVYTSYMRAINPQNLALFIESYLKRTDLAIARDLGPLKTAGARQFKCPVMLVAGDFSPHLNDLIHMNGRLNPAESTWMKFECGGMIHEEAPNKLCDAFRLFLQGMGYVPSVSKMDLATSRTSIASNYNLLEQVEHPTRVTRATVQQRRKEQPVC